MSENVKFFIVFALFCAVFIAVYTIIRLFIAQRQMDFVVKEAKRAADEANLIKK